METRSSASKLSPRFFQKAEILFLSAHRKKCIFSLRSLAWSRPLPKKDTDAATWEEAKRTRAWNLFFSLVVSHGAPLRAHYAGI